MCCCCYHEQRFEVDITVLIQSYAKPTHMHGKKMDIITNLIYEIKAKVGVFISLILKYSFYKTL